MIYDLAQAVKAVLRSRKFGYPVEYAPERFQRHGFAGAIVFERDRGSGDRITAPVGSKPHPGSPFARKVGGVVTIYVRSPKAGADTNDHEDECDKVCDGVLCAISRVCKSKPFPLEITESRLLGADEMKALRAFDAIEKWPGCAARIRFLVTTQVRDVDYAGAGPLTAVVESVELDAVTSGDLPDFDPTPEVGP